MPGKHPRPTGRRRQRLLQWIAECAPTVQRWQGLLHPHILGWRNGAIRLEYSFANREFVLWQCCSCWDSLVFTLIAQRTAVERVMLVYQKTVRRRRPPAGAEVAT